MWLVNSPHKGLILQIASLCHDVMKCPQTECLLEYNFLPLVYLPICLFTHVPRLIHDDVIKWKHFLRYCPFVRGIHRSPVISPDKGQWRGALMLSFICARINGWVNSREAGDLGRHRAHYDVIVVYNTTENDGGLVQIWHNIEFLQMHNVYNKQLNILWLSQ